VIVEFTLEGTVVGVNYIKTPVKAGPFIRILKSKEARKDHTRISLAALEAARQVRWVQPTSCAVYIDAYNSRKDIDSTPKIICDGMNKIIYEDDRSIIELHITKHRDLEGERYVVRVESREAIIKPKPLPKPRKAS
jgi:Holliday junction resolvase RusA-like endonuclease